MDSLVPQQEEHTGSDSFACLDVPEVPLDQLPFDGDVVSVDSLLRDADPGDTSPTPVSAGGENDLSWSLDDDDDCVPASTPRLSIAEKNIPSDARMEEADAYLAAIGDSSEMILPPSTTTSVPAINTSAPLTGMPTRRASLQPTLPPRNGHPFNPYTEGGFDRTIQLPEPPKRSSTSRIIAASMEAAARLAADERKAQIENAREEIRRWVEEGI